MLSKLALVIANNVNYRTNLITYVFIIKAKLLFVCFTGMVDLNDFKVSTWLLTTI
jgi:hypothetical protein